VRAPAGCGGSDLPPIVHPLSPTCSKVKYTSKNRPHEIHMYPSARINSMVSLRSLPALYKSKPEYAMNPSAGTMCPMSVFSSW
jgi:hypothetical protein